MVLFWLNTLVVFFLYGDILGNYVFMGKYSVFLDKYGSILGKYDGILGKYGGIMRKYGGILDR